jgi:hypothetical protein
LVVLPVFGFAFAVANVHLLKRLLWQTAISEDRRPVSRNSKNA